MNGLELDPNKTVVRCDLHDTLWRRVSGKPFVGSSLTEREVDLLKAPLEEQKPWNSVVFISRSGLPVMNWENLFKTKSFGANSHVFETIQHSLARRDFINELGILPPMHNPDHKKNFVTDFEPNPYEMAGLKYFCEYGFDAGIISSLLVCCGQDLIHSMQKHSLWPTDENGEDVARSLDKLAPACLRRNLVVSPVSPAYHKPVAVRLAYEKARRQGQSLMHFEDNYHHALVITKLFPIEVHMPVTEEEARSQSMPDLPKNIKVLGSEGEIRFRSGLYEVANSLGANLSLGKRFN